MDNKVDVLVIGSGIGGLCCGALCARSGREVLILEAHTQPGGAAHGFDRAGYHFESGPSLWSGLSQWPSNNPLAQILRALNQSLPVISYRDWEVLLPEGKLQVGVGNDRFETLIKELRGLKALKEWQNFCAVLQPIAAAAGALPLLSMNPKQTMLQQMLGQGTRLMPHLTAMRHLTGAFGPLVDSHLQDSFLRNWVDLLCFLISGMPMGDTNAAAMATLFGEWFSPEAILDYPLGGSAAVVAALVNGLEQHGGELKTNIRVSEILVEGDRAIGARLNSGELIHADQVVSNADVWSTMAMLPSDACRTWQKTRQGTPACGSFMHLHLGFDASGLEELPIHSVWVGNWEQGVGAAQNVLVLSIPSVLDPSMAPVGQHVLHGYTPANEPWTFWEDLKGHQENYQALKQDRCQLFWKVLEQRIPDIRDRCNIIMEGSPITHRRFLNVHQGSYGPALSASSGLFPGVTTPLKGLWMCGSSTFPGIGIPPVAASGAMAAHGIVGIQAQKNLLQELDL